MVGVGRTVMGAMPSCLVPRRMSHSVATSNRDGGAVTGVSGWDPDHIHCGNGGPTPPVLGAVAERLAFNAFVRRAGERHGRLSLCREMASSGAEMSYSLEGRFATLERGGDAGRSRGVSTGTLERGGDRPVGSRGMRMGHTLGFFESFAFF